MVIHNSFIFYTSHLVCPKSNFFLILDKFIEKYNIYNTNFVSLCSCSLIVHMFYSVLGVIFFNEKGQSLTSLNQDKPNDM